MSELDNPELAWEMEGDDDTPGLEMPLRKMAIRKKKGSLFPALTGLDGMVPSGHSQVNDENKNSTITYTPATPIRPGTPSLLQEAKPSQDKGEGKEKPKSLTGLEGYTSVEQWITSEEPEFHKPDSPAWAGRNLGGPIMLPRRFSDPAFNTLNEYSGVNEDHSLGDGRPLGLMGQAEDEDNKSEPYTMNDDPWTKKKTKKKKKKKQKTIPGDVHVQPELVASPEYPDRFENDSRPEGSTERISRCALCRSTEHHESTCPAAMWRFQCAICLSTNHVAATCRSLCPPCRHPNTSGKPTIL
jgi:hypothetical protein